VPGAAHAEKAAPGGNHDPSNEGLRCQTALSTYVRVSPTATSTRKDLINRAAAAGTVAELFAAAARGLRQVVPFDGTVWLAVDPATGLATAPTWSDAPHVDSSDACQRAWELELLIEDVNLFRGLARADTPAAGLRMATGDRPKSSARYREFLRPNSLADELRGVLRTDGSPWAYLMLFREAGRPAFTTLEVDLVASLSAPLAAAVRDHSRAACRAADSESRGPGLMLFGPDGELISVNDDALAWLEEITWLDRVPADFEGEATFGLRLPTAVAATLVRARAIAQHQDHRAARTRILSQGGRWLVCHASCLRDANGTIGNTALVIEPAKASEIAPIIVRAYQLSAREQQIAGLISQGAATSEIAGQLCLSTHTVRDHIKAIFEKVGVASRGELVAKLFAEHYAPTHFHPDNQVEG
jgi:DNA-binding CsgD family transcriptional regulator